jgi:two-component system nitrogen regulation response regulator GlnG
MSQILIVDDEESICWGLERLLTEDGHQVNVAASAEDGLAIARREPPDLAVFDVRLPGLDGLSAMEQLTDVVGPIPIVVITAFGNLDTAVKAVRNGAFEYLPKPFDLEQAAEVIRRGLEQAAARRQTAAANVILADQSDELLGTSSAMQEVFKRIALVASSDVSVLITGESGTGKELVARAIHRHSSRASRPLLPVNLAALSPTLVESELFGHARGAFTGAEAARTGLLELANQATVFFDEAGDIPLSVQVKLLRVLEQREVTPVGDTTPRRTSFRLITATSRDLAESMRDGTFREDLYFRLAGFEIALPPLRRRVEDIPLLANHFLARMAADGRAPSAFTDAALAELCRRPWPGNVRQLRNAVEHGVLLARGGPIGPEHLPPLGEAAKPDAGDASSGLRDAVKRWATDKLSRGETTNDLYQQFLADAEPPLIETVLDNTSQNRLAAADLLGIHRATLRKKLT